MYTNILFLAYAELFLNQFPSWISHRFTSLQQLYLTMYDTLYAIQVLYLISDSLSNIVPNTLFCNYIFTMIWISTKMRPYSFDM